MTIAKEKLEAIVNEKWENSILPALNEFIRIPNISPSFDKDWQENGHIEKAVSLAVNWCLQQNIKGMKLTVERLENRSPLIFIDIAATDSASQNTVLFYGHLDKQPEMTGWDDDKDPWKPVLQDNKLYGRGAADDGYAIFTSLVTIQILQEQGIPHSRCVLIFESCEEGGSHDLPYYIDYLGDRIGNPEFIICLDSGCGNYDQLWLTTSLRGIVLGNLSVELLQQGIHSGNGGGVIASGFRVLRNLLDRLEDAKSGEIHIKELQKEIPEERLIQASKTAKILGSSTETSFPLIEGVKTVSDDPYELILNRTWRPSLSYIAADGFPKPDIAGNVLRPKTVFKISMRIPPLVDSELVAKKVKDLLETDPPYQSKVKYSILTGTDGWNAPPISNWFENALNDASQQYFDKEPAFMGEGGSVPFMNLLSSKFPKAEFMVTGVLGPYSNAHGPNEFLHLPVVKKLTCCIVHVLAKQAIG